MGRRSGRGWSGPRSTSSSYPRPKRTATSTSASGRGVPVGTRSRPGLDIGRAGRGERVQCGRPPSGAAVRAGAGSVRARLRAKRAGRFGAFGMISSWKLAHGRTQLSEKTRWSRHGRRSRHGQYARLRPRARDRALRAVGGGDRLRQRPRPRGRGRGEADAGSYAWHDHRDPPAQGRRHRRLRCRREDAALLHQVGPVQPLRPSPRGRLRPLGGDRGREARGRGGLPLRRRPSRLPDRGADGGGDRRRSAGRASRSARWSSTSAAAPPRWR